MCQAREQVEAKLGDPTKLSHYLLYCNNLCARKAEDKLQKPKLQQQKYTRTPLLVCLCVCHANRK